MMYTLTAPTLPSRSGTWTMEMPGRVKRLHHGGGTVVAVLEDGRTIDLSQLAMNAKPSA